MAGMLLLNPRPRKKARAANPKRKAAHRRRNPMWSSSGYAGNPKRRRNAAKRRVRRNPAGGPGIWSSSSYAGNPKRRRNAAKRRRNPIHLMHRRSTRRHRNPLAMGSIVGMLKDAALMGAGAVAIDVGYGYVNAMLPASLQVSDTTVNAGDAVKVAATVAFGALLDKPTRGLSRKAAMGSLVVQMHGLISSFLPATVKMAGLGWAQPTAVIDGQHWVGPNKRRPGVSIPGNMGYLTTSGGSTPLLRGARGGMGFLTRSGGSTPLLRGAGGMSGFPGGPQLGPAVVLANHGIAFK